MAKDYDKLLYNELTKEDFDYSKVKRYIKKGGSLNFTVDEEGTTVLMKAIIDRKKSMLELYLKRGINLNVNAVNNKGNTALMLEIDTDYSDIDLEIVHMLIEYGADVNLKNNFGMTPLEYAVRTDRDNALKTIKILLEKGADISKCKYNLLQIIHKESEDYKGIRKLLKEAGVKQEPFIFQYNLKLKCKECNTFNPINAPVRQLSCIHCQSIIEITDEIWQIIFENNNSVISSLNFEIDIEKRRQVPICTNNKCKQETAIEEIPVGTDDPIICKACGNKITNHQAPDWLKKFNENSAAAQQIIGVETNETLTHTGVVTRCISCGAGMNISPETPRMCTCEHCLSQQYLPDDIWKKLHPVSRREPWYIYFKEDEN